MQPKIPLVHIASVTKLGKSHESVVVVFDDMTVTLPTNEICAVFGKSGSGRSTLLRLISGAVRPDSGAVLSQAQFSIICNAGAFFNSSLTGFENIALAARLYGMDAGILTEIIMGISNFGPAWEMQAGDLTGRLRKSMEMLVAALLPYDCFLVDDVERVDPEILQKILGIAEQRGAGLIFTAQNPKHIRQFATCGSVIADHTVHAFESIKEALENYA